MASVTPQQAGTGFRYTRRVLGPAVPVWTWSDFVAELRANEIVGHPFLPFEEESMHDPVTVAVPSIPEEVSQATTVLVRAMIECLNGRRSPAQLNRWFDDKAMNAVLDRVRIERGRPPLTVASLRLQMPTLNAVEATARLVREDRSTALALRLERKTNRWMCRCVMFGPR